MEPGVPIVKPQLGPTLPALVRVRLGTRSRTIALLGAGAVLAIVLAGVAVYLVRGSPGFSYDGAVPFGFGYDAPLRRSVAARGEIVRLEHRRAGRLVEAVVARPLRLPRYEGALSGSLPLFAAAVDRELAARYPGFVPVAEGRLNPGDAPLYGIGFASRAAGRPLYGLDIVAVPDRPGARDGIELTLLATRQAGVRSADEIGVAGPLRTVLKSFAVG